MNSRHRMDQVNKRRTSTRRTLRGRKIRTPRLEECECAMKKTPFSVPAGTIRRRNKRNRLQTDERQQARACKQPWQHQAGIKWGSTSAARRVRVVSDGDAAYTRCDWHKAVENAYTRRVTAVHTCLHENTA